MTPKWIVLLCIWSVWLIIVGLIIPFTSRENDDCGLGYLAGVTVTTFFALIASLVIALTLH